MGVIRFRGALPSCSAAAQIESAPEGKILPIALSEWRAVVQQTHNVRMAEGDFEITNPKTGEIIRLRNAGGDAEAFFPQS